MRYLLILLLMAFPIISHASYITCYSHGKIIYAGYATEISSDGHTIIFKDKKTGKDIFILGDCVIRI